MFLITPERAKGYVAKRFICLTPWARPLQPALPLLLCLVDGSVICGLLPLRMLFASGGGCLRVWLYITAEAGSTRLGLLDSLEWGW